MALAAIIRVMSGGAPRHVLTELVPEFEQKTGHKIHIIYIVISAMQQKLSVGEIAEMVLMPIPEIKTRVRDGSFRRDGWAKLGTVSIGLAVRGLYGEGTEALGNLFQVSNQTTLGEKEEDIIARLHKVIEQIIEHEQNARQMLLQKKPNTLLDHIGRGYGVLRHAYSMNSKEALNLLSFMKLGIDLGFFPEDCRQPVDELFMETQPAHLQKGNAQKLAADERDALRAEIIRAKLSSFPKPSIGTSSPDHDAGNGSEN